VEAERMEREGLMKEQGIVYGDGSGLSDKANLGSSVAGPVASKVSDAADGAAKSFQKLQADARKLGLDLKYTKEIGKVNTIGSAAKLIGRAAVVTNVTIYWMMENETLAYKTTQYDKVSTKQLTKLYDRVKPKIGKYYFDESYEYYTEIYSQDGRAATKFSKVDLDKLDAETKEITYLV